MARRKNPPSKSAPARPTTATPHPEGWSPPALPSVLIDVLLGWFVPGAGHLSRGFRRQGLIVMGVLVPLFVLGLFISDFEAVSRDLHPYAFWAEIGIAGGTLPLVAIGVNEDKILEGMQSIHEYQDVPALNDTGVLFCCIAGLLNLLALFDLLDRSLSPPRLVAREEEPAAGGPTPEGAPA